MSRSINRITLLGFVGSDPEIRTTSSGTKVAKCSLATNREWKDSAGTSHEEAQWHRLTFFGKLPDVVEEYVSKGDRLFVEGRIEYSQTEHEGVTRYWTDIVVNEMIMLGSPNRATPGSEGSEAWGDL